MTMQPYRRLNGKSYWSAAITDNGDKVFLCGRGVRSFSCHEGQFVHTLCMKNNAIVTISHDQKYLCVLNASQKRRITLTEFVQSETDFSEERTLTLSGGNTDGGKPCYTDDDKQFFFCTEAKQVWRYVRSDGKAECVYQVAYPDQRLSMDLYADKLLIVLNSPVPEHNGFDVLDHTGARMKSLRYHDNSATNKIIRGRWLNEDDVVLIYPSSFQCAHDSYQIVCWQSADVIEPNISESPIDCYKKALYDVCVSPKRNYIACVWMDMLCAGKYTVEVYDLKTLKKMHEHTVSAYMDLAFSKNEKFLFLCSEEYVMFDISV